MDIHKPRPWHGVREFAKEYLIIVIGVLTALGAEQVVEQLHWRRLVQDARETMKPEYLRIIANVGRIDVSSPCLVQRMNEVQDILRQAQTSGRLPTMGPLPNLNRDGWGVRAWDGIVAAQVLPHLPHDEGLLESGIVSNGTYLGKVRDEAIAQWTVLATLNGPARTVTPGEVSADMTALAAAGRESNSLRANADTLPGQILKTGLVSKAEAEKAWRQGAATAAALPLCHPIPSEPGYLSAALPDVVRPNQMPF